MNNEKTSNKDKRQVEVPNRDPIFVSEEFTYNNALALPVELKTYLTAKNLDWRFLNAQEFRKAGSYHKSHWKPLTVTAEMSSLISATTAEGLIQRGDLILGVRPKAISSKHREFLAERNRRYSTFAKDEAEKLREDVRRKGLSGIKVEEGYGKEDKDDSGD